MCFRLFDLQSLHQPAVLLWCQLPHFAFIPRPLVDAAFQTFVQQDESVLLPVQALDPIPAASAEKEQSIGKRVKVELLLHHGRKSVDPFSQIRVATGDVHTAGPGEVI